MLALKNMVSDDDSRDKYYRGKVILLTLIYTTLTSDIIGNAKTGTFKSAC